jgi:protease-4
MKKFLLGILVGLVFAVLATVVFLFSLLRFGESVPTVPRGATLVLRLSEGIPEKSPVRIPIPFIGTPTPLTVHEIWSTLQRAATDSRIRALVIHLGKVDAGWAKLYEIRQNILNFRRSGKPVYVYLSGPRTREYYLATAADRIYAMPEDLIDLKGLRAEVLYFKNTLDKLGIQVQVQHVGRYKDAGDMFTETSMSPATRESLGLLLDGIYSNLLQSIATGRKRTVEEIGAMIDEGPYTARQAAAKGVVDALRYEDQVYGDLKDALKSGEIKKFSFRDYIRATASEAARGQRVALIVGEGTILRGGGDDYMGTDEGFTSRAFIRMLRQVAEDKSIRGVILRVDSPGGDAFASDEMLREVQLLRSKKPMVISFSDSAASGGYYVSMTGDPILAYPTTITGSIGVLFTMVNIKGLYDKLGINREVLTRGKNAGLGDMYGPIPPEGREKIQAGLDEFYTHFVSKVAQSRNRKYEEVEPLAQGRVWLGVDAKNRGLVDHLGGLDAAVDAIRRKASLKAGERVTLVPYPPRRTLLEQLMKSTSGDTGVTEARLIDMLGFDYRVWERSGFQRLLPYQLRVQ